jgi:hypothetical protein
VLGVVLTAAVYGASLFLPAFTFTFDNTEEVTGWDALAVLPKVWWEALRYGISEGDMLKAVVGVWNAWPPVAWAELAVAWSPNPLLLAAVVYLLKGWKRAALATSALAFLLGLFVPLMVNMDGADGHDRLYVGYWLWLVSLGLPAVFAHLAAVPAPGRAAPTVRRA